MRVEDFGTWSAEKEKRELARILDRDSTGWIARPCDGFKKFGEERCL